MGYKDKKYTREEAHDKLYRIADKLLARMNACSKCPIFVKDSTAQSCGFSKAWCCEGCPHLGAQGCTVEALLCRLHLCAPESNRQWKENSILRKRQKRVYAIARSYNILLARASKEQAIELAPTKDIWWLYRQQEQKFTGENI